MQRIKRMGAAVRRVILSSLALVCAAVIAASAWSIYSARSYIGTQRFPSIVCDYDCREFMFLWDWENRRGARTISIANKYREFWQAFRVGYGPSVDVFHRTVDDNREVLATACMVPAVFHHPGNAGLCMAAEASLEALGPQFKDPYPNVVRCGLAPVFKTPTWEQDCNAASTAKLHPMHESQRINIRELSEWEAAGWKPFTTGGIARVISTPTGDELYVWRKVIE